MNDPIASARQLAAQPHAGVAEYARESLRVLIAIFDQGAKPEPAAEPVKPQKRKES